jgi:hypothetical protein
MLLARDSKIGASPTMAHYANPHDVVDDTKREMIGKPLQVHAAKTTFANREGLRPLGVLLQVVS